MWFWLFAVGGAVLCYYALRWINDKEYDFAWRYDWDEWNRSLLPHLFACMGALFATLWVFWPEEFVNTLISFNQQLFGERYFLRLIVKFFLGLSALYMIFVMLRRIAKMGLKHGLISTGLVLLGALLLFIWAFVVVKALLWVAIVTLVILMLIPGVLSPGGSPGGGQSVKRRRKDQAQEDFQMVRDSMETQRHLDPFNGPRETGMWGWRSKDK